MDRAASSKNSRITEATRKPMKGVVMKRKLAETQSTPPRRLSAEWPRFVDKLAVALEKLEVDQFLLLSVKDSDHYVQFAASGAAGMRAETTSNWFLKKPGQLNEQQISALTNVGWHAPTRDPAHPTPEDDPDGSPNFYIDCPAPLSFIDCPAPLSFETVAGLAAYTFAEVLRVPHPGFLEYKAFDKGGNALVLAELGLPREGESPSFEPAADLMHRLLVMIGEMTGIADLDFDEVGDITIQYGSVTVSVGLVDDPLRVRIYGQLLADVEETPKLLARINEINSGKNNLHFFVLDGAVLAISEVPADPIVSSQVSSTLKDFCEVTDAINRLLQVEFGGKTSFYESMQSSLKN